jgi:hypothetical protein
MKKIIFIAAGLAFMATTAFAQKKEKIPPGPLDKKTFAVERTKDGKKKGTPEKEDLKFASGKFNWTTMVADGYKPAAYEATYDSTANPITCAFTSEAQGDKDMVFKWEGTITGDDIEGTATLTKKGKVKESYAFSGTIKGKKPKKE